jgi:alkylated DNA repair dioxygenase AlkB
MEHAMDLPPIPGLLYLPEVITPEEEAAYIHTIDAQPWDDSLSRRVQHYGYRYDYRARSLLPAAYIGPLPDWLAPLAIGIMDRASFSNMPNQVIVNAYLPGQGIALHTDCIPCFGPVIASLSLASACVMDFRCAETGVRHAMSLAPRSLLVLSEAARYVWRHGIAARRTDVVDGTIRPRARRISVTFRTVRVSADGARLTLPVT